MTDEMQATPESVIEEAILASDLWGAPAEAAETVEWPEDAAPPTRRSPLVDKYAYVLTEMRKVLSRTTALVVRLDAVTSALELKADEVKKWEERWAGDRGRPPKDADKFGQPRPPQKGKTPVKKKGKKG